MGDWFVWGGTTSSVGLDFESFAGFPDFFDLVTGACLGPAVTYGVDFAVWTLFVFVISFRVGVSVTGPGM